MPQHESHAQLLTRAARAPRSLGPPDHRALGRDVDIVARVIDWELVQIGARLLNPEHCAINGERWAEIIDQARRGTLAYTALSEHELLAIGDDPRLSRELEDALDEGWSVMDGNDPGRA